jgi:hypothetical protein
VISVVSVVDDTGCYWSGTASWSDDQNFGLFERQLLPICSSNQDERVHDGLQISFGLGKYSAVVSEEDLPDADD